MIRRPAIVCLLALMLGNIAAFGHGGGHGAANVKPHDAHELLRSWEFDPLVIIGLILTAILYGRGLIKLHRVSGHGVGVRSWEATSFVLGWLSVVAALVSPLHPWGRVLFSAHMTQHEVLMLVAAPLIVLGRPMLVFLKGLPGTWSRRLTRVGTSAGWRKMWRLLSQAFVAWVIHGVALWIWHIPPLFQATIDNDFIHSLQHMSFFFSALLFWWAVMDGRQKVLGYGLAVLSMFTTALHSGLLGALLTFTTSVWYPEYSETTRWWGLTPLEDQQLGGLIMWVPAGIVYIIAGVALFAGWMRESGRRAEKRELNPLLVNG